MKVELGKVGRKVVYLRKVGAYWDVATQEGRLRGTKVYLSRGEAADAGIRRMVEEDGQVSVVSEWLQILSFWSERKRVHSWYRGVPSFPSIPVREGKSIVCGDVRVEVRPPFVQKEGRGRFVCAAWCIFYRGGKVGEIQSRGKAMLAARAILANPQNPSRVVRAIRKSVAPS